MSAALSTLPKKVTNLSQLKIVDPPKSAGKKAYPISTFTYVIVPTSSGDKAADLRKFVVEFRTHAVGRIRIREQHRAECDVCRAARDETS